MVNVFPLFFLFFLCVCVHGNKMLEGEHLCVRSIAQNKTSKNVLMCDPKNKKSMAFTLNRHKTVHCVNVAIWW